MISCSFKIIYMIYLFFIILLSYGTLSQQCPTCPTGFTFYPNGNKCLKAFSNKKTFYAAMDYCNSLNSHLVFIMDEATNTPLRQVVQSIQHSCNSWWVEYPSFWSAGRKPYPSKTTFNWVPSYGTLVNMTYTNWRRGEPNNEFEVENCIHFILDEKLDWNDTQCDLAFCFVCEVDM